MGAAGASVGTMSGEESRAVSCRDCGADLPSELAGLEDRQCTECGSRRLVVHLTFAEEIQVRDGLRGRVKDTRYNSKKNPRVKFEVGASYSHKAKKWMHRERLVDRVHDRYREVVSDPETGQVVHRCEEPLSKHRGHGDDKRAP